MLFGSMTNENQFDHLYDVMFTVAYMFPLICIIAEALLLVPYKLKFRHRRQDTVVENAEK